MQLQRVDRRIYETDSLAVKHLSNVMLLLKHELGGFFPGLSTAEYASVHNVLEVGCGTGTWGTDLAQSFYQQRMRIVGLDTRASMIGSAHTDAQSQKVDTASYFLVDQLAGPFEFLPSGSFDLISGKFLSLALFPHEWSGFLDECRRLLRPGGRLCLTDCEAATSNAPAHEEISTLFLQAMHRSGRSFSSSSTRHLGLYCELEPLLVKSGFTERTRLNHFLNYSSGEPRHREWTHEFLLFSQVLYPFLVTMEVATLDDLMLLHQRQKTEMRSRNFHAVLPILTLWGTK